ncbi:Ig-like domain-containing protein, partial [Thorsellia kenyensis]
MPPAMNLANVQLIDDVGTLQGNLSSGDITDDTLPTITGVNAPAYAKEIAVFVGVNEVGRATVQPNGTWTYQFTTPLTDGSQKISIAAVTEVGNVGSKDANWTIIVDTKAPEGITVDITSITEDTEFAGDFITKDNTLTFSGSLSRGLSADERIEISLDGGKTWAFAIPTGNSWYYDNTTKVLADGEYNVQVRVVDLAGNVGATDTQKVVVDTKGPDNTNSIDIQAISPDTGVEGDFKTSENIITVSGILGKNLGTDELVKVTFDGGKTWKQATVTGNTWFVEIGPLS